MNTQETHNGWTNYATWRVALEVFDGYEVEEKVDADWVENYVEDVLFTGKEEGLVADYARAFLADVNWYEIADSVNENLNQ